MFYKNISVEVLAFIFSLDYSACFLTHLDNETRSKNVSIINKIPALRNGRTPDYFDWREQGAVSPIKEQKDCSFCWAFGIAGHLESQYKLRFNKEILVSEQFLIDCLGTGTGCQPGNVLKILAEISSAFGGVLAEQDYYPYASGQLACRCDVDTNKLFPVVGSKRVYPSEADIIEALLREGPLIAGINTKSMKVYRGGIDEPTDRNCDPNKLDHVVLIVGYNAYIHPKTKQIVPYWIIKNSWSDNWGDNGFYYLVRGRNACGIESQITHAFVK